MTTSMKKVIGSISAVVVAFLLCMILLPGVTAKAETRSGTWGTDGTWTLDDEGTLTISGTGEMNVSWASIAYASSIKNVIIKEGVTSIGDGAFRYSDLKSITIPNGVTSIGDSAFEFCVKLKNIEIPSSVTSIGDSAFEFCVKLKNIEIPSSVTSIGPYAFANCSNLESIILPSSVTSIGRDALGRCYRLKNIYYLGSQEQWNEISRYAEIPDFATVAFEITVKFDADGIQTTKTVMQGEAVTKPADPTKESDDQYTYAFAGWFTEPTGGSKVTDFSHFDKDTTLYAHWTKTLRQYSVSWNANGGDLPNRTAGATVGKVDYGTSIKAPTAKPTRQGYIFEGWFDQKENGNALGETTKVTKTVTYYAYWVRKVPQNLQVEAVDDQTFGNGNFILNVNRLGKGAISYKSLKLRT